MRLVDLLEAVAASFHLPSGLNPDNYIMTNRLSDAKNWKAMTYASNTGKVKTGQMGQVGYIMISKKDDTIIPISRSDEHHHGFDMLHDLARKVKGLNPRDYVPVWPYGNNYIYSKEEIPIWLNVLTKYFDYGGNDGVLIGANDLRNTMVTLSSFVKSGGNITVKSDKLASIGEALFNGFTKLAEAFSKARTSDSRAMRGTAFRGALELYRLFERYWNVIDLSDLREWPKKIRELQSEDNLQGLEEMFFGFDGVKNKLHNSLRAYQDRQKTGKPNYFEDPNIKGVWGDVDLAVDMLGRL